DDLRRKAPLDVGAGFDHLHGLRFSTASDATTASAVSHSGSGSSTVTEPADGSETDSIAPSAAARSGTGHAETAVSEAIAAMVTHEVTVEVVRIAANRLIRNAVECDGRIRSRSEHRRECPDRAVISAFNEGACLRDFHFSCVGRTFDLIVGVVHRFRWIAH